MTILPEDLDRFCFFFRRKNPLGVLACAWLVSDVFLTQRFEVAGVGALVFAVITRDKP